MGTLDAFAMKCGYYDCAPAIAFNPGSMIEEWVEVELTQGLQYSWVDSRIAVGNSILLAQDGYLFELEIGDFGVSLGETLADYTVTSISAGYAHTCATTSEEASFCWGNNSHGQLGHGVENGDVGYSAYPLEVLLPGEAMDIIITGANHSCGYGISGDVYCWGSNTNGELGLLVTGSESSMVYGNMTGTSEHLIDFSHFDYGIDYFKLDLGSANGTELSWNSTGYKLAMEEQTIKDRAVHVDNLGGASSHFVQIGYVDVKGVLGRKCEHHVRVLRWHN